MTAGQLAKLLNNTFFTIQLGVSFELARLASEMSIDSEGLSWALPGCIAASWIVAQCGIGVHPPRPLLVSIHGVGTRR